MSEFSNKSAMSEALNSLHRYIRSMYISVDLPEIATSALEVYFNCENTELQATFDKMIGAAAIQAIYEDKDIPQWLKARAAKRAAEELQDAWLKFFNDTDYKKLGKTDFSKDRLMKLVKEQADIDFYSETDNFGLTLK